MAAVPNTEQNMKRCLCGTCPTFPGDGGFYCAKGKSAKAVERRGCKCAGCENFKEFGLTQGYYCDAGSAADTDA
jgi:hypothetical protein